LAVVGRGASGEGFDSDLGITASGCALAGEGVGSTDFVVEAGAVAVVGAGVGFAAGAGEGVAVEVDGVVAVGVGEGAAVGAEDERDIAPGDGA
jgi:hypothetical protein